MSRSRPYEGLAIRHVVAVLGQQFVGLANLNNDPAVEESQQHERAKGRQRRSDPVDVVDLIGRVEPQRRGPDIRRVVGPAEQKAKPT